MKEEGFAESSSNPPLPADISVAVEVGRRLASAREAAELSQHELAGRLRLGERQIVALEAGNLAALPGKTFVRGFVRNYALAVTLDPQPLLALLEQAPELAAPTLELPKTIRVAMPPMGQSAQKRDRLIVAFGAFLLLVAIAIYFFAPPNLNFSLQPSQSESFSVLPVERETMLLEPVSAEQAPQIQENEAMPVTPAASPLPVVSSPAQGNTNLRLDFHGESWVEIIGANEQKLHSRLHPANSSYELKVAPPVTLVIGRASGVSLYFQGKQITLQPSSSDVAQVKLQ